MILVSPLETRNVPILMVRLLDLYQSRGAVGHAPADIRRTKHPPPWDHDGFLGIGLLQGPTGGGGVMSEVTRGTRTAGHA